MTTRPSSPIKVFETSVVLIIVAIAGAFTWKALGPPEMPTEWNLTRFGKLPVQEGGRIKPIDTVARTSLMLISQRQSYKSVEGDKFEALQWFTELVLNPKAAASRRVFRIDHPDIVGLLGFHNEERKYFSLNELAPHFNTLQEQFTKVNPQPQLRTPFEDGLVKLQSALRLYDNAGYSFIPPSFFGTPESTYNIIQRAYQDVHNNPNSESTETAANALKLFSNQFSRMADNLQIQSIPPTLDEAAVPHGWENLGESVLGSVQSGEIDPIVLEYAHLSEAFRTVDTKAFKNILKKIETMMEERTGERSDKADFEVFFNSFAPFVLSTKLYVLVFIVAAFSWLTMGPLLSRSAFWLLLFTFGVHTFGIFARIYIQERPPVTNLYSSAVFVSWAAIPFCLFLEKRYRNGIAAAAASLLGFCTLIIAHHLSFSGDTMQMMRAVLDSNFWLATHVPTVTIGYSATFLAGAIAAIFLIRDKLFAGLEPKTVRGIDGMVYGTICFALLFSFVGTVLGGIWADQSWGRFWGWDPKENGALMIVLWNAVLLHARWGKVANTTALMQLAVFGNIITAWSWFGTNMLGVGLHSYGFMDAAFFWLMIFFGSQMATIAIGFLPSRPIRIPPEAAEKSTANQPS